MNRSHSFSWFLLFVWGAWANAISGYFVQFGWPGSWSPDLGLVLLVALAVRTSVHDIAKLAVCLGIARAAVSVDAPAAVLAASLVCGGFLRVARSMVQLENPLIVGTIAAALCLAQSTWLEHVHLQVAARSPAALAGTSWLLGAAVSSGLLTALFGGVFANLPGLGRLAKRKAWVVGASYH
jgi:hypothetical protein